MAGHQCHSIAEQDRTDKAIDRVASVLEGLSSTGAGAQNDAGGGDGGGTGGAGAGPGAPRRAATPEGLSSRIKRRNC